ncbi:hypothetical protein CMV30_16225 [Nibricoccus aquaticus]|uniref:PNPLA domain-containing protein n=1 Tax=Nibricoccus aquaticus TaxID=2576891 RepID=A0A290QA26_9BACT|nr:patatin-like phospholipase family protein [Nibricoccus aquaticus]ATC65364.1 hypothetical protein CMV30_16225 [Nibricoccus aquaticus]
MAANPTPAKTSGSFSDLIKEEYAQLKLRENPGQPQPPPGTSPPWIDPEEFDVASSSLTQEPWVRFTKRDLFGLAFSGGGIRSATFNLGILQALERLGVLRHVNYLSTVSGGGYVGSFWTAWLRRRRTNRRSFFPSASENDFHSKDERESPEVRHLREFSRFLMPRVGFWHFETWGAIVAILGGMIPAMVAALATIAAGLYSWFLLSALALKWEHWCSTILFGVLTLTFHLSAEWAWRRTGKNGNSEKSFWRNVPLTAMTAVIASAAWFFIRKYKFPDLDIGHWTWPASYWEIVSEKNFFRDSKFHLSLLLPSAAWFVGGIAMLGLRGFVARSAPDEKAVTWSGGVDRSAARCFSCAVIAGALAVLWTGCHELLAAIGHTDFFQNRETSGAAAAGSTAAGGALFGAVFFWLRDWLSKPSEETRATNLWEKYAEKIKPLMPQFAALGAMFCMVLTCVLLIQSYGSGPHLWIGISVSAFFIVLTLLCFDPARIGMHDFYRSRLARCYLGAAPAAGTMPSRATAEQTDDDIRFGELRGETVAPGPIHLVCCAANNLAGDPLSSLYRGARSVAISPIGLSLGNEYAAIPHLRLSSAVTASAAAFNSQMGRVSMDLGFAVAFVMSAFNLRLGLWVPHPGNPHSRLKWLVGLPFFFEMFGRSKCPSLDKPEVNTPPPFANNLANNVVRPAPGALNRAASAVSDTFHAAEDSVKKKISYLHLSDGSHFENLGLYELVRRHCRYIIVTDSSADPEVAFDDLANTLRRIREDFGVEIELDVEPLRPGENGRSAQHAVIGCIHYDGMAGTDKGTVIYFKPTLTGDEPADVLQYQTRNIAFPHEGTGDQFYDEAQWESYRRLGEHAAISVLRFEVENTKPASFVDNMFLEVCNQWHPNKAQHQAIFLELTARCGDLENEIRASASNQLLAELFPEAASATASKSPAATESSDDSSPRDENIQTLFYLMRVLQIMEDAYVGAELNEYWSHPLNAGWMSYFQRWASTPSFRHWWPVLRSVYSAGFRHFVKERFDLRLPRGDYDKPAARLDLKALGELSQLPTTHAWHQWKLRFGTPVLAGKKALAFALTLEASGTIDAGAPIDVGFLLYQEVAGHEGARCAAWDCREMFVPHALNGAGISARFLESTIDYFRDHAPHLTGLRVDIDYEDESSVRQRTARPNRASRLERVQTIGFYKSRGFTYLSGEESTILCFDLERARTEHAARRARHQKLATASKHA